MSKPLLKDAPKSSPPPPLTALPEWFRSARNRAAALAESLPMPARTDEAWRFSNLRAFDPGDFAPACPVSPESHPSLLERSLCIQPGDGRLVFANDQLLAHAPPAAHPLPPGVLWLPLAQAIAEHPLLVEKYFMRSESSFGSAKHLAAHQAHVRAGTFLYVPKGVRLEAPLHAWHWLSGSGQAVFPHTLIVAEEDSALTFVDWLRSEDGGANLACGVNDIHAGPRAQVRYACVQDWNPQTVSLQSNTTLVEAGAHVHHLGLHFGGKFARTESISRLKGAHARSEMLAATVANAAREFDQRTLQDHLSADTTSDLLYKNALYDSAKTIFSGLIRVEPAAHHTDAYQKVRNLVLSPEAEAVSLPGLEILADQVRCSHGATTGEIHPEELFYMQARGIPEREACGLITFGFLNEVLERFPDACLREALQLELRAHLPGHHHD